MKMSVNGKLWNPLRATTETEMGKIVFIKWQQKGNEMLATCAANDNVSCCHRRNHYLTRQKHSLDWRLHSQQCV